MNLSVVCWWWRGAPSPKRGADYAVEHVARLASGVRRHIRQPHRMYCVTDRPEDVERFAPGVVAVPLPELTPVAAYAHLRKLWIWSPAAHARFGSRVLMLDLDVVVVGDLDASLVGPYRFYLQREARPPRPWILNTSALWLDAGAPRATVWGPFKRDARAAHRAAKDAGYVGSDQAVAAHLLRHHDVPVWTARDGFYGAKSAAHGLPPGARLIAFYGPTDPSTTSAPWVAEHWKGGRAR